MSDDTEIVYVPGSPNYYDYENDVIVLDARLEEYPLAHEVIREHELAHAECEGTLDHLLLELRTDFWGAFATDDRAKATREYLNDREPSADVSVVDRFGRALTNMVRPFWSLAFHAVGYCYRGLRGLLSSDDPNPHAGGGRP